MMKAGAVWEKRGVSTENKGRGAKRRQEQGGEEARGLDREGEGGGPHLGSHPLWDSVSSSVNLFICSGC